MRKTPTSAAIGRRNQKGLTLIELSIALAIAAALLFGLFYVVNVANAKRIVNNEAQTLTMMGNDLRTKFSGQGSFAGLNTSTLIQIGIPPETMIEGTTLRTGFSTPVTVSATNVNGQANDGFEFDYTQFPSRSCSDFVMAAAQNFSRVTIGSTVVKNIGTGNTDTEITVAELAGCEGNDGVVSSLKFAHGR